jgi:hypothetical protein
VDEPIVRTLARNVGIASVVGVVISVVGLALRGRPSFYRGDG